jgi:hypothetical protein
MGLPVTALMEKGRAASGIAVHLGKDDTVHAYPLIEGLGHVHGFLTGHGVYHQDGIRHLNGFLDVRQLLHHGFVDLQTACRIQKYHVLAVLSGMLHGCRRDLGRLMVRPHGEDIHAHLFAVDLQLFDGCGPVDIQGCQQRLSAPGFHLAGQLGCCGGLAGALQAHHHDDSGLSAGKELYFRRLGAHQTDQFVVDDLDDHLGRIQAVHDILADRSLLNGFDEVLDDLEIDIGFQKSHLYFAQGRFDIRFAEPSLAAQILKYVIQFIC